MSDELIEARAFLDAMIPLLEAAERSEAMLRRRLGTAFSIASYSVGGYEVPLNRIIADLLDPHGPHGQGGAFLKLFLDQIAPDISSDELCDWAVIPSCRTRCGRYVDIALFNGRRIAIYVESKPWAEEGTWQLRDYAVDLLDRPHEQKWLLFLPGSADREPQTLNSETRHRLGAGFVTMPFQRCGERRSVLRWLEQCMGVCEADNVRVFVSDLAKYLDAEFPNQSERKSMSDDPFAVALRDTVLKNPRHLELVLRFERMAPDLKRTVAFNFIGKLKRTLEVNNPGWIVENSFEDFESKYQSLGMRKASWPKGWAVRLSMEGDHFMDFRIGFCCPSREQHLRDDQLDPRTPLAGPEDSAIIQKALTSPLIAIGEKIGTTAWWPGYCHLPVRPPLRDWNEAETFLLLAGLQSMPDGSGTLDRFVDWFQDLAHAAETRVDTILAGHAHAGSR